MLAVNSEISANVLFFGETLFVRSFAKIKPSRNDEITLSFIDIKSVKKARSAIKLCSYDFSFNVSNDINVTRIHLSRLTLQEINNGVFNKILLSRNK